ncbi:hydroxymethylglutaryl-CoA lyase [Virgibacillus sp. YIM 98842]|uniref:hydroxymethylglutaryl-CoA lyase n=1 Tax=Virgibacillus sp. YIM 98842 TaxID=2663533 RepID=UPI0013DCC6AF|nr:hydroxymethylglutaryl-CoA lyase [Virgibacillus sp. YIM 98842]
MSIQKLSLPSKAIICEVAPRDGFQMEADWIPTEEKVKIIRKLAKTGVKSIEVTSFVHPKAIPQLKDAEEVVGTVIDEMNGIDLRALVPNLKGAERAVLAGVKKVKTMLSATDSHSLSNANATVKDAQDKQAPIFDYASKENIAVMGSVSVAFGCPFEGAVPVKRLVEIVRRYNESGVREISLADTTGMAHPKQVYDTLEVLLKEFPHITYSMHFHNTRGMALANTLAALQQGVTHYDSSIAGLGGCPYAPGATGNVATEDLVHMLEEMGVSTSTNLDELIHAAEYVRNIISVDKDSYMLTAGPSSSLHEEKTEGQKKVD